MCKVRMLGFFKFLLVIERMLPLIKHIKQHMKGSKNPLINLRQKFKQAKKAASFVYRLGLRKGRKQGLQQGQQQEREHIARRLLKMGCSQDTVCKMTGLTKRELEQL